MTPPSLKQTLHIHVDHGAYGHGETSLYFFTRPLKQLGSVITTISKCSSSSFLIRETTTDFNNSTDKGSPTLDAKQPKG